MKVHRTASLFEIQTLSTDALRQRFLLSNLFREGEANLVYTDLDRAIIGGICPTTDPVHLNAAEELRAAYFMERREAGVLNVGKGRAEVLVDGDRHLLEEDECLYMGRGIEAVSFRQVTTEPVRLFFVSLPAHTRYPTVKVGLEDANKLELGSGTNANERTIYQYIHPAGIKSCQLVMGFTEIQPGSVWNTMPPHTHERRSEYYLYYDMPQDHAVVHLMGEPQQSRHLLVRDGEAVLSPSWSMHAGCGTSHYKFVWAMGGENQSFDDMDPVGIPQLR